MPVDARNSRINVSLTMQRRKTVRNPSSRKPKKLWALRIGEDYFSLMEEAVKRGYFTTMTQVVERGIELAVEEAVKKGLPNPEELSPATRLLSRIRDAANG